MDIVGLDIGRSAVKVKTENSMFHFPSVIGEWRERRLQTEYENGFEVEFQGEKYFAGTLAENESDFARQMMTENKAHQDTLLLALIALHKAELSTVSIVTGLPINTHTESHKQAMRTLLEGKWDITVNGVKRTILISKVDVAVEGGAAFWSSPADGLIRLIDAGSKTVNYVTMNNKRYVDRESGTLELGFDTNKSNNIEQFANRIAGELGRRWKSEDVIYVSGGRASDLTELLTPYFPNARVIKHPLYANALGYYRVGKML